MYNGHRVKVVTAAGRRRYMQLLLPYVLASPIVDQYDIWVNTVNKSDIAFFQEIAKKYNKINLVWSKTGIIDGVGSMNDFYSDCAESNTIYIKLDDDVVWMEDNFFEEICKFRVENPHYFLVTPLVINNGIGTFILQARNKIVFNEYFPCQGYELRFLNGGFAEQLHKWFYDNFLSKKKVAELHCNPFEIAMQQFPINAVAWFGESFQKFDAKIIGHDEIFLTVNYPALHNLISCYDCNTIIVHYAFNVQMEYLDKKNVIDLYHKAILNEGKDKVKVYQDIQDSIRVITENQSNIEASYLPRNYKSKASVQKQRISQKIKTGFIQSIMRGIGISNKIQRATLFCLYLSMKNYKRAYIKDENP